MSRKKIVAATMTAAALGLAFAGYTATRANGTDEVPVPLRAMPLKADAGYRQNHQVEHNGAVFGWMDAAASLDHTQDKLIGSGEAPVFGQDLVASATDDEELAPVAIEHANRVGPGTFAGFGLAGGAGGGGTPKGGDEWSGGRYASSFGGGGFGGGFFGGGGGGGAGTSSNTKGSSGTNDPSADKPHTDAPALSNSGTGDKPGSNNVEGPPANPNPPAEQQKPDTQIDPGPVDPKPVDPKPVIEHPDQPADHPVTNVPEPATLGLLGFGMIAAAALRRRRRS